MNNSSDSVTEWLRLIGEGNNEAASSLWQRYSERLTRMAKSRLRASKDPLIDEEDLAVCVFASLIQRLQTREIKPIKNRIHLWRVLAWATRHRAADHLRRETALKRTPRSGNDSMLAGDGSSVFRGQRVPVHRVLFYSEDADHMADDRLPAELMVDFLDELNYIESKLPTGELRRIVRLKLDGWQNNEIADQLDKSLSSIERKLRIIREVWLKELFA